MERLNKNSFGQFEDERFLEIKEDIEKMFKPFINKWKDIDSCDLSFIIQNEVSWLITQKDMSYKNSITENIKKINW